MKRFSMYILPVTGFILLVVNAIGYLFDVGIKSTPLVILGIIFVVIGMAKVKKEPSE